jgi:chromate transporter
MKQKLRQAATLFFTFFKIGAFTFGGGYAMIPLIQRETAEKRSWVSNADILDIIAIAESTPGPIAINAATFVGYRVLGAFGAFCATFGVALPSFLIILAVSRVLGAFESSRAVRFAFAGIRAGVLALIVRAFLSMYRQCPGHVTTYAVAAASFLAVAFLNVSVPLVLAGCALTGLVYTLLAERRAKP